MKRYFFWAITVIMLVGCNGGQFTRSDIADHADQISLWEWYDRPGGEPYERLNRAIIRDDDEIKSALLEFRDVAKWFPEGGGRYSQIVLYALMTRAGVLNHAEIGDILSAAISAANSIHSHYSGDGNKQMTASGMYGMLYKMTGDQKWRRWADEMIDTVQTAGALEASQHYADIGGTSLLLSSLGRNVLDQNQIEALCQRLVMTSTITKYPWGREWWSLREPGNSWWMTRLLVAMQLVDNKYYKGQLKRIVRQSFEWLADNNYTIPVATAFFDGWDDIEEDSIPDGIYCEDNLYGLNSTKAQQQYERNFWESQVRHKNVVTMKYKGWFCALYNAWLVGKGDRGNSGAMLAINGPNGDPLLQPRKINIYNDPEANQSVAVTSRDPVNGRVIGTAFDDSHAWIAIQSDGWSRSVNLYFDGPRFEIVDTGQYNYVVWHILWDNSMEIVGPSEITCQGMRWRFEADRVEFAEKWVSGFYSDHELEVKLYGGRVVTTLEED